VKLQQLWDATEAHGDASFRANAVVAVGADDPRGFTTL